MGWQYTQEEYDTWQLAERGGAQGDYRDGVSFGRKYAWLLLYCAHGILSDCLSPIKKKKDASKDQQCH